MSVKDSRPLCTHVASRLLAACIVVMYMGAHSALICHVLPIYHIAGKFDGELNLAVWQLGLKVMKLMQCIMT